MVEFPEDVSGLLPDFAGGIRVADRLMGIAKMGEHFGDRVPVTDLPGKAESAEVADNGLLVPAEMMVGDSRGCPA